MSHNFEFVLHFLKCDTVTVSPNQIIIIRHLFCRDGVTQSGLFAAIGCIWERMKDEHEVDIFQTVKHLRFYKREIIRDLVGSPFIIVIHCFLK